MTTKIGWTHVELPPETFKRYGDTNITFPSQLFRGETWNPVTGCDPISPGCDNCYAQVFAERWRGTPGHPYEQGFDLKLWPERLERPLQWQKPRGIFVNSMSDWLHEGISDEYILQMFEMMLQADWHIYQLLTKRANRLPKIEKKLTDLIEQRTGSRDWPEHIWIGATIESAANIGRAKFLRDLYIETGAITFISYEPMLGELPDRSYLDAIRWLIMGGESGTNQKGKRAISPINLDWIHGALALCEEYSIVPYIKQLGTIWSKENYSKDIHKEDYKAVNPNFWPEELRKAEYRSYPRIERPICTRCLNKKEPVYSPLRWAAAGPYVGFPGIMKISHCPLCKQLYASSDQVSLTPVYKLRRAD